MNLRRRINQDPIQLQLAPMIDVILFLLCFFLLTWNLARYEQDLEVKVPVARNGTPPKQLPGEVIINLQARTARWNSNDRDADARRNCRTS